MSLENISFAQFITGKLRQNLEDYNFISRSGTQWIYPDKPMITKIMNNKNNFPRISIETLNMPTISDIGMGISEQEQTISLKITVWSIRDLICTVKNTIDETILYDPLIDIYTLNNLPLSDITTVNEGSTVFIKNIDYKVKDNDDDGLRDSIEWLSGDKPITSFDVTYKRIGTGSELCRIITQNINKYLRDEWRNWDERNFWGYKLLSANPIDFDTNIGVSKYEMTIQFSGINIGDEI